MKRKIFFLAAMFAMISAASVKAITIGSPSDRSAQFANDFTVSWSGSSNVSITYKLLMYYPSPGSENETGYGNITGTYTVSGYSTTIPLTSSQWMSAVGRFLKIFISDNNSPKTAAATCYVLVKPKVTTGTYTNLKTTSVDLNGTATYCTKIYFYRYRKTGTSSWSDWSGSYYPDISGLTPCTQYEYRVAGTGFPTNYLDEYIYGDIKTFTTLSNTPSTPGSISGSTSVCVSSGSTTYSISSVSGATSYTWTLPSGWSGSSTGTNIAATPSSNAQSGYVTVKANNSCGSSSERSVYVTVNSTPSTPGTISGSTTVCTGASTTYSISSISGATSYTWTLPSGWSGSSTSTSISATPGASAQSGTITVKANNDCGSSSTRSLSVTVNTQSVAPTSISGTSTIVSGNSTTLSVSGGSLGTGATWKWYSGSCGGAAVGTGSSITVSPTSPTTYYVRAEGTCNTTSCASKTVIAEDVTLVVSPTSYNFTASGGTSPNITITSNQSWTISDDASWLTTSQTNGSNNSTFTMTATENISTDSRFATVTLTGGTRGTATVLVTQDPVPTISTGVEEVQAQEKISIFPNPAKDEIFIKSEQPIEKVEILDIAGHVVVATKSTTVNIAHLSQGIYFVRIVAGNQRITEKIIKK